MTSQLFLSRRVFIDTGAYFALAAPRDDNHSAATAIETRMIAERLRPFTTNFILAETHALLLRRVGRAIALRTLAAIRDSAGTTMVRVSAGDERRAWEIIEHYDDKNFSMTDATSFAIMDRLHITQAFTFDENFTQYGLSVLTPA